MLFPYNFFKKLCIAQSERLVSPSLGPGSAEGEFFLYFHVISLPKEQLTSFKRVPAFYIECWFSRGKNRRIRGKTSRSKGEKQQQTQPLYGVDARIQTRAALVGEECSHHCPTTLAPLTGSLRRPADQQASLWVRDWVEQQKKSATEAVD